MDFPEKMYISMSGLSEIQNFSSRVLHVNVLMQLFSCQLDFLCVCSNFVLFRVYIFEAIILLKGNEVNVHKHGKQDTEADIQRCFYGKVF